MIETVQTLEGSLLPVGAEGLSAYEVYVKNGGTLSETEWLNSLKGETGEKGDKGDTGSVKFIVVTELPTENIDDTAIYIKPVQNQQEKNKYEEFIYVNNAWESLGTPNVEIDLSNYYTKTEVNEKVDNKQDTLTAGENITIENNVISASGGSSYPIYRMDARWDKLSMNGSSSQNITSDTTIMSILTDFINNVNNQTDKTGVLRLISVPSNYNIFSYSLVADFLPLIISGNETSVDLHSKVQVVGAAGRKNYLKQIAYQRFYLTIKWENGIASITNINLSKQALETNAMVTDLVGSGEVLTKTNTASYTPSGDYNPATKKYVDDAIVALKAELNTTE